jgi:hypothetical protein
LRATFNIVVIYEAIAVVVYAIVAVFRVAGRGAT